ncbi:MAG: hypothetical protein ACPG4N_06660 [Gammaproteobacteria bacterium]
MPRLSNHPPQVSSVPSHLGPENHSSEDTLEEIIADLEEYPAAQMILAMGLRLDALCETHSESEMRRVIQICGHCGLSEPCQRNFKSCNRNADLIDECPLWDAGLLD